MQKTYCPDANASYISINPELVITHSLDFDTPTATVIIDFADNLVVGVEILHN
jgi:uncharacterized protein YuzE